MSVATSTRIKVTCTCGKKYLVRSDLIGKRGKCKCGEAFTVPAPTFKATPQKKKCPWCSTQIGINKVSCQPCERRTMRGSSSKIDFASTNANLAIVAGAMSLMVLICAIWQAKLNGPEFLVVYGSFLVICCLGGIAVRVLGCPRQAVAIIAIGFVLLGGIRYGYGVTHGMHNFTILALMMVLGTITIAVLPFIDILLGGIETNREHSHSRNGSRGGWGSILGGYGGSSSVSGYGSTYSGFSAGGCSSSSSGGCGGGGGGASCGGGGGCGGCGGGE